MNSYHSWTNREVKRLCDMTIYTNLKQLRKRPGTTLSQKKKNNGSLSVLQYLPTRTLGKHKMKK